MSATERTIQSETVHLQVPIAASPARIFRALTDPAELTAWFAEHAAVSLADGRYDFWGRYTLGTPAADAGRHPILACDPPRTLRFGWHLRGADTTVAIALDSTPEGTLVTLRQENSPPRPPYAAGLADFWSLALLNLQSWVERGTIGARCDYAAISSGTVRLTLEIAASPAAVFASIIRPEELNRYIAERATVEPWVGGTYSFGWPGGGPIKILDLVPDARLAYSWSHEGEPETIVTWELAWSDGRTHLTLVHSGFAPDEPRESYHGGWLDFLVRLKNMVEVGPHWRSPHKVRPTEPATAG